MKKLFLVALAAVGLASCVQNEELAVAGGDVAIAFGDSYVHNATKADPTTTTETIEGFDVWAFMDEVGGTVLADEDVTKSGGAWGYANIQYWAPNHTYYFAALSPMNSANITSKTLAAGEEAKLGLGEIAFTNVAGTEDLLYAKEKAATPATLSELTAQGMDAVEMEFQHLLSKVKFTFQNGFGTSNMAVKVSDVAMKVANNAKIDLAVADYSKGWKDHAGETTLAFGDTEELASAATGAAADERLTIPADATATYEVTFKVQVWSGSILALETAKTATISGYALEMGKAYNFTAVINNETLALPAIEFTAVVDEWTPAGDVAAYKWENDGFGLDTLTGIYHVTNLAGLDYFAAQVNGGRTFAGETVVLDGDLDLSATRALVEWTPIGNVETTAYESKKFAGIFDGNGYSVKNMVVTEQKTAGFFGSMYSGTIKNLTIENATVNSNHYAAGLIAWVEQGGKPVVIENCHVKNSTITTAPELVNGVYDNGDKAGGLVGHAYAGAYKNCSVENVAVKGYRDLGGIAGYATKATVSNCLVKNVTITQDLTNGYKSEVPTTLGAVVGRVGANNTIENNTVENVNVGTAANNVDELNAALAASDNASIVLAEGTFNVGNGLGNGNAGELTVTGAGIDKTTIDAPANQHGNNQSPGLYGHNKDLVFKNLTFVTTNNGYEGGIGHAKSVTFINCKIVGQFYCHSNAPHTFIDCTIDPLTGYLYTYASNCDFEGCTFTASEGKALQVYAEASGTFNVNIKNCEFTAAKVAQTWDKKPVTAIDINSAYGAKMIVNIENCEATGFGVGEFSGNGLWNIKSGALNEKLANVTVDGEVVYMLGAGSTLGGYYEVDNCIHILNSKGLTWFSDQLNNKKNTFAGKTIQIENDIDMAGVTYYGGSVASYPSYCFKGVFDGCEKVISNLTVTVENDIHGAAALIPTLAGDGTTIKNVILKNVNISSSHYTGGIFAYTTSDNCYSIVTNCHVEGGAITGNIYNNDNGDKVGGIGGLFYNGIISGCSVKGVTISGYRDTAGLVGYASDTRANIKNNSLENVTINVNNTNNYKNYTNRAQYDVNNYVGEGADKAKLEGNTGEATINWGSIAE